MAKRNGSTLDDLAQLPWWVKVVLAVIVYISLGYWIPTIKFQNAFFAGTAKVASVLAPFLAGILLFPSAISAFNSWRKGQLPEKQKEVKTKPSSVSLNPLLVGSRISDNICPLCGGEMELKTAISGPREGEKFWGCTSYPKCRGKKPHHV